jgi:hypothetical protein
MPDLHGWVTQQIDAVASAAARWHDIECDVHATTLIDAAVIQGATLCDCGGPASVLRRCAADRKLLDLHTPEWTIVEWPDDQNGRGEAQVCRSCGNKDIDQWMNWKPLVGEAGEFPEGVKPPYVAAPCATLRAAAEGWGWTEEGT